MELLAQARGECQPPESQAGERKNNEAAEAPSQQVERLHESKQLFACKRQLAADQFNWIGLA